MKKVVLATLTMKQGGMSVIKIDWENIKSFRVVVTWQAAVGNNDPFRPADENTVLQGRRYCSRKRVEGYHPLFLQNEATYIVKAPNGQKALMRFGSQVPQHENMEIVCFEELE